LAQPQAARDDSSRAGGEDLPRGAAASPVALGEEEESLGLHASVWNREFPNALP